MKKHRTISLRTKLTIGISIIGLCITFTIALIGINLYRNSITGQYNHMAYQVAEVASGYPTDEELKYYAELVTRNAQGEDMGAEIQAVQESSRYLEIVSQVDALRAGMNANAIFLCVCNLDILANYDEAEDLAGNWKPVYYILDTYKEADLRMQMGDIGSIEPSFIEATIESYSSGVPSNEIFVNKGEFGYNTSAVYPVVVDGKTEALVGVEIPMTTLQSDTNRFIFRIVLAAVIATGALLLLGTAYMVKRMITPIKLVATEAERFVADNNAISEKLPLVKTNDEIQTLSESLLKLEIDINDYIENLTKVTAEKERIGAELNVATQIQADMLPSIFPPFPEKNEFGIFASMTPAKEVGGDFYDFFLIDDDHLALVMADVSGKGVPAALFMVIAKTLIKNRTQMVKGGVYSPGEILGYVNEQLCEGNEAGLFVTVWLCILELSTGKAISSNAGHEYPAIRRAGGQYELIKTRHSPAVAVMEGMKFREEEFVLHAGDSIYVYTDGVTEATNAGNELFGNDRLEAALNENPDAPAAELLHTVKRHIDAFVGDAPQFDDITMLGVNYYGSEGREYK